MLRHEVASLVKPLLSPKYYTFIILDKMSRSQKFSQPLQRQPLQLVYAEADQTLVRVAIYTVIYQNNHSRKVQNQHLYASMILWLIGLTIVQHSLDIHADPQFTYTFGIKSFKSINFAWRLNKPVQ